MLPEGVLVRRAEVKLQTIRHHVRIGHRPSPPDFSLQSIQEALRGAPCLLPTQLPLHRHARRNRHSLTRPGWSDRWAAR